MGKMKEKVEYCQHEDDSLEREMNKSTEWGNVHDE